MYVSIRQLFTDFSEFVHIATTPSVWLPTHGTADCLPTRKKIKLAAHARCSRLSKILKWLDPSIFTLLYKATIYWISECSNCVRGPSPMCASSNFSLDHYTKLNCGPRMQWLRSWSVTNVRKLTKKITNVRKLTKKNHPRTSSGATAFVVGHQRAQALNFSRPSYFIFYFFI